MRPCVAVRVCVRVYACRVRMCACVPVRRCAHRYPQAYTHAPVGIRRYAPMCVRVTREGAGGRVGARVFVWYPHVYKKSIK